jgi:hypothetical protein
MVGSQPGSSNKDHDYLKEQPNVVQINTDYSRVIEIFVRISRQAAGLALAESALWQ